MMEQPITLKRVYTREEIEDLIQTTEKPKLRVMLQRIFSYPENIALFGEFFFSHALTSEMAPFHNEWYAELVADKDSAVAAPRDHAKSTTTGGVFVPWCVVNKRKRFIVYVSQSHDKTVQFVDPIRTEFKENTRLRWVYGDLTVKGVKSDKTGKDREDCFDVGETRIQAVSFERNMRGFRFGNSRPDLIICDDIEQDERVHNAVLRDKDSRKFKRVIVGSLDSERNGRLKVIGTVLNQQCLLIDLIRLFHGKIYRAILPDGSLLWPGRWSMEKLEDRKRVMGSSNFRAEYMNDPVDNEAAIIKAEWIRSCFDESLSYFDDFKYDYKYLGCDFAFSDRVTADKSAFIGVGSIAGQYVLHSIFTKQGLSGPQQFGYIDVIYGQYGFTDCALEENSIQSMSRVELKEYSFKYTLFWTANADAAKKERPSSEYEKKRHTVGKKAMIQRMATIFENQRIALPYKTEKDKDLTHSLMDELVTFALDSGELIESGVHSDMGIALALALERAEMDKYKAGYTVVDLSDEAEDTDYE